AKGPTKSKRISQRSAIRDWSSGRQERWRRLRLSNGSPGPLPRLTILHWQVGHTTLQALSKVGRGGRGWGLLASPWPRLQRKLDLIVVPAKKAASTLALLKPDIGPQSRPKARAASMK